MSVYLPEQGRTFRGTVALLAVGGVALVALGLSGGFGESDPAAPAPTGSATTPTSSSTPPSITCEADQCWWTDLGKPERR
ncbi:hypothetical protein GCM10009733_005720 [Nonomuraea maheshkhaliensis]|uniref:Uncharacterized protein n=1 Tax=Nonomuraea maheshkhaliensis TaxID=419590 RepID=A0ABN2EN76_9ACTN